MQFSVKNGFNRAMWIKIHVYLALSVGLLFVIMGLTGSLSVYRDEIDALLNPEIVIAETNQPMLSVDKIIAAVRAAHPDRHGVWTLEMPRTAHSAVIAWFEQPRETYGAWYAPLMVAVNPYTAEVINSRFWGHTLTTWVLDLHSQLLLEGLGRKLVAALGILLIFSICSGIYLWWPGWRNVPKAFVIPYQQGLMRLLFDLHKLSGILSSGLLLVLAFTGFHLAYPTLLETLTAATGMGHGDSGPNVHSSAVPNNKPVNLAEAVLIARGPFPSSEVRRISTPLGETGTYRINLRQRAEINQHHPATMVWIDRWSGQIRDVQNPLKFTTGQTFTTWLWPVHTGEAFGGLGRFLWFLSGLMPLALYVSGISHWLYKRGLVKDRPVEWHQLKKNALTGLVNLYRLAIKLYYALKTIVTWLLAILAKQLK